jgi:hypothetical protein
MIPVPLGGRAERHAACAVAAINVMVDRAAFTKRDADHFAFCLLGGLFNSFRNFARFRVTVTDAAFAVADNHERCECETASAFYGFRDAVDADQAFNQFGAIPFSAFPALFSAFSSTSHSSFLPSN